MHGLAHLPTSDGVHATACSLEAEDFSLDKVENNISFQSNSGYCGFWRLGLHRTSCMEPTPTFYQHGGE